jgi:hypothetical protein
VRAQVVPQAHVQERIPPARVVQLRPTFDYEPAALVESPGRVILLIDVGRELTAKGPSVLNELATGTAPAKFRREKQCLHLAPGQSHETHHRAVVGGHPEFGFAGSQVVLHQRDERLDIFRRQEIVRGANRPQSDIEEHIAIGPHCPASVHRQLERPPDCNPRGRQRSPECPPGVSPFVRRPSEPLPILIAEPPEDGPRNSGRIVTFR